MRRKILLEIISFILRIVLGVVFIYAAIGKIEDPTSFSKEIANYRLFPMPIANIFAIFIPWVELIIGTFLVFGLKIRTITLWAVVLLVSFTLLVSYAWAIGLNINCGCFSHHIEYVGLKKVLENLLLIISGVYLFFYPGTTFQIEMIPGKINKQSETN